MVGYSAVILGDLDDGLGAVVLVSGPGDPFAIALEVLKLPRAARRGEALAAPLEPPDPTLTADAAAYAGMYRGDAGAIRVVAEDDRLVLDHDGDRVVLEPYGDDMFIVPHPDYDRFVLSFGRHPDTGDVVELFHGAGWHVNDRYQGPTSFDTPSEWEAFPGHYRAHNPWATNFRVVHRKGSSGWSSRSRPMASRTSNRSCRSGTAASAPASKRPPRSASASMSSSTGRRCGRFCPTGSTSGTSHRRPDAEATLRSMERAGKCHRSPRHPGTEPLPPTAPRSSPGWGIEEADAEQGAGEVRQPLEEVGSPLVADAEAAAAEQPGPRAFDPQRCRPSRALESIPRRASRGVMPRAREARRGVKESYALSAWSLAGRFRGRPGRP